MFLSVLQQMVAILFLRDFSLNLAWDIIMHTFVLYPLFKEYMIFIFVQTDRAAMLDEIVDYVKFLRLQVKVKQSSYYIFFLLESYIRLSIFACTGLLISTNKSRKNAVMCVICHIISMPNNLLEDN